MYARAATLYALTLGVTQAAGPAFRTQVIDSSISIGYGLATGDVDGDGKKDILLADAKEIVWYRNPAWEKKVIASGLTQRDNVCIAARDIDGDGRVEVAVGAQWNPGETNNDKESGAVFYLQRPAKDGDAWTPVQLPHDVTVHRMHWIQEGPGRYVLAVLPLHGAGNTAGSGPRTVRLQISRPPAKGAAEAAWTTEWLDTGLHITHNFDLRRKAGTEHEELLIGGREGLVMAWPEDNGWKLDALPLREEGDAASRFSGTGEVRFGNEETISAIEPFHGPALTVMQKNPATRTWERSLVDKSFNQGHALAWGTFPGVKNPCIVAGWREPDAAGQFGVRIYSREKETWQQTEVSGKNSMACEDLRVEDLDGDGQAEIVAAGRATKNVVIYWPLPAK